MTDEIKERCSKPVISCNPGIFVSITTLEERGVRNAQVLSNGGFPSSQLPALLRTIFHPGFSSRLPELRQESFPDRLTFWPPSQCQQQTSRNLSLLSNPRQLPIHISPRSPRTMRSQSACFIAMDDNAGVESMERCRIFVRRGEGLYKRRSITRVVRAGNGGRWRGGGIPLVEVSVRSVIIVSARSENTQRPRTM